MSTNINKTIGSRAEVWNGSARKTSGGLTRADLIKNKHGRIVSRKKQEAGRKAFKKNQLIPKSKEELARMRPK